jgi:succinate dehydrogenase (ubiquinone) membrane anchor subunit
MWTRLVCVGLVPITIAPFAAGTLNPTMDAVLCSLLILHSHVGFQYVLHLCQRCRTLSDVL